MKTFVALRLINQNSTFPKSLWQIGYKAAPQGYAFKQLEGDFDVLALAKFANLNGLEAHICDARAARQIHGLPV